MSAVETAPAPKREARTAKGRRQSELIVEATIRCLARDGYAATSLQAVADEAGVGKRAVIYYFDNRETLFDEVVRRLGDQLHSTLRETLAGLEDPESMGVAGFAAYWNALVVDRALLVAWFGLRTEAITSPELKPSADYITAGIREVVVELIDRLLDRGYQLTIEREALVVLAVAGAQGLILQYLEDGDTPELRGGLDTFQAFLAGSAIRPED